MLISLLWSLSFDHPHCEQPTETIKRRVITPSESVERGLNSKVHHLQLGLEHMQTNGNSSQRVAVLICKGECKVSDYSAYTLVDDDGRVLPHTDTLMCVMVMQPIGRGGAAEHRKPSEVLLH